MYSASKGSSGPPPDVSKYVKLGIVALIVILTIVLVGNQAVLFFMNYEEFDDLFTTPLYFSLISGIILSSIALVRVNIVKRSSILWYTLQTAIGVLNRNPTASSAINIQSFLDLVSNTKGELKAKLISSKELSLLEKKKIQEDLSKEFKTTLNIDYKYDADLIAGLIIQVGSVMVDTSIKAKLKKLERNMVEA